MKTRTIAFMSALLAPAFLAGCHDEVPTGAAPDSGVLLAKGGNGNGGGGAGGGGGGGGGGNAVTITMTGAIAATAQSGTIDKETKGTLVMGANVGPDADCTVDDCFESAVDFGSGVAGGVAACETDPADLPQPTRDAMFDLLTDDSQGRWNLRVSINKNKDTGEIKHFWREYTGGPRVDLLWQGNPTTTEGPDDTFTFVGGIVHVVTGGNWLTCPHSGSMTMSFVRN